MSKDEQDELSESGWIQELTSQRDVAKALAMQVVLVVLEVIIAVILVLPALVVVAYNRSLDGSSYY